MDPELVAPRSDIVLADLDGNWEKLYVQGPIEIDSIALLPEVEADEHWPERDRPLVSTAFSIRPKQFEDFFHIDDCDLEIVENLLFYGNGLALLSRAKVFYDAPRGFSEAFGAEQGNFGATWTAYFEHESHDERMGRDVAGYDRAYFWSLLGDWTLDLKPASTDRSKE